VSEAVRQHHHEAPGYVRAAILTISDSRTPENDTGGDAIREILEEAGHEISARDLIKDEPGEIRQRLTDFLARDDVDAVITTGGTGISLRDSTYEVVEAMLEKRLDGFGEIFRTLSYEEIGAAAMMSRAVAGTIGRRFVASLPGSANAARLATEKLLAPEMPHVVFELRKQVE
jgi:molybdenum cofactor biosynthesis protein B